jgi:hypothetical protein
MSKAGFSRKPRIYIPKCRKEEENPPRFSIRRLTPLEITEINESFGMGDEEVEFDTEGKEVKDEDKGTDKGTTIKVNIRLINKGTRVRFAVLEKALTGWEDVHDEDGEVIPFEKSNIPCLDLDIVNELSNVAEGAITKETEKNYETPSSLESGSEAAG